MSLTLIILAGAIVTFLTRISGHLILLRFDRVHFRIEAALSAIPAAVLTTLISPFAFTNGWLELITLLFAGLIATRLSMLPMFIISMLLIISLRYFIPV